MIDTEFPTTAVLFIDGNDADRTHFARKLKECSSDYAILEAPDGDSGLALYRSQRIDCVILELNFPDRSGFEVLVHFVPIVRRPHVAVIVLTKNAYRVVLQIFDEVLSDETCQIREKYSN